MEVKTIEVGSSKLKPVYPYFARRKTGNGTEGVLCLVHLFGAFMVDVGAAWHTRGDSWTWATTDAAKREKDFIPLPVGTILQLENT